MDGLRPSRTAFRVAVRRATHQLYDPPPLVFEDPYVVRILGAQGQAELEAARKNLNEPANLALRAFLICRSRYAEDCLAQAVAQGVRQYVLLGAGLDTFAHRNPHPGLRVFEVDHPATQAWKRSLVEAAGLPHPPALIYAPCNFECESLDRQLAAAGFDPAIPAFFAWLGVVPYLTLPAFRATVGYIASGAPGSGLVFDYAQPRHVLSFREQLARDHFAARVAKAGEPFQLYFTPAEAARQLADFFNLEDQGCHELNSRYFADRRDHLRLYGQSGRIVSAWL
jgi:methyltransferase (TIGR00027 family)